MEVIPECIRELVKCGSVGGNMKVRTPVRNFNLFYGTRIWLSHAGALECMLRSRKSSTQ